MHYQHWIIKSVCVSVSESVTQNELNALQIAIFHRSSINLPPRQSPRRCGYLLFLVEIRNISIRQTGSGINPHHCSYGKISLVSYLENGARYDVAFKGGQIGNRPRAFYFHYDRWPWMTLNPPSSRSLQLQSNILVYEMQQHWADTRSIERISC